MSVTSNKEKAEVLGENVLNAESLQRHSGIEEKVPTHSGIESSIEKVATSRNHEKSPVTSSKQQCKKLSENWLNAEALQRLHSGI